jgi:hypothetical protein
METAVQKMAVVWFFVLGLSHMLRLRAWAGFVVMLRSRGEPGALICETVCLGVGVLIVSFHQVWRGIPMVLTLFGWMQIAKALWYFTMPRASLRHMERVNENNTWLLMIPGRHLYRD